MGWEGMGEGGDGVYLMGMKRSEKDIVAGRDRGLRSFNGRHWVEMQRGCVATLRQTGVDGGVERVVPVAEGRLQDRPPSASVAVYYPCGDCVNRGL